MGLPSASSTACEVKFSDGIRLINCFCLIFSYTRANTISMPSGRKSVETGTNLLNDVVHDRISLLQMCRQ